MEIISENSPEALARLAAEQDARDAARELAINILRVVRGAGRPYELGRQADALLAAMQQHWDASRTWPYNQIADELRISRREFGEDISDKEFEWQSAQAQMVAGSLQIAASRLAEQPTQEAAGRKELFDGLARMEAIREANRVGVTRDTAHSRMVAKQRSELSKLREANE